MELRRSKRIQELARPVSPNLWTAKRTRGHHIESQQEKEEKEFEAMKKYKFRAKPPPNSIFKGSSPTGLPQKKVKNTTSAKTPNALRRKATSRSAIIKAKNKSTKSKTTMKRLKALPLPDLRKVFEVTKAEMKITKSEPFSFEKKYEKPNEVKDRLLKEAIAKEKKLKEFKATPLYESAGFQIDKNISKTCTKIEPFNLAYPDAYHDKLKKLDETMDKENEKLRKKREFKAKYPHVLYEEAFVPEKDSRYCPIDEFNLHSEKRGEERKKFDLELEEQKLMIDKEMAHQEKERSMREKEEVAELRKKLVHKANDVGEYKKQEYEKLE